MKGSLKTVFKIREVRESKAMVNARQAKDWVDHCEKEHEKAKNKLSEYYVWRDKRENELFLELQNQVVGSMTLEEYQAIKDGIWSQEAGMLNEISEHEKQVSNAAEQLLQAKKALIAATTSKEKLSEIISNQDIEESVSAEIKEELELEEFNDTSYSNKESAF